MKRRDALRMLAAAGTAATGSLIVSQPARADTGSESCRFEFSGGGPVATFSAFNTILGDSFEIDMSVSGSCQCGATLTSIEYAYFLDATNNDFSTGSGWVGSSSWNAGGTLFANLWPFGGGSFTVTAGVRVTCTGPAGVTTRCRYATSSSISIGGGFFVSVTGQTLTLGTNNGDTGQGVLPACNPPAAPLTAARLFSRSAGSAAGAVLMMQPGPLVLPDEVLRLQAGEMPVDPFGNPLDPMSGEPLPAPEASTTTEPVQPESTSTTSTTTAPKRPTDTTTTSTSTTSTTTTTTSTTAPPAGTTPPPSD